MRLGFGAQTDTRIIRHGHDLPGTGQALNGVAVANYIAKYATKTLTAPGLPSQPATRRGRHRAAALLGALPAADHHRLAARPPARCRAWAHMLGYGGHFLTKSRRYSVTFGQLRQPAPTTAAPPGPRTPTATPGAAPWTRPSSWSCPSSGPTKASAAPSPLTPNSRSPPPPAPASTVARSTLPSDRQLGRSDRPVVAQERLLTINEVADLLRISRWSVYQLIWSGQLRTLKIGRRRLVRPSALAACVDILDQEAA